MAHTMATIVTAALLLAEITNKPPTADINLGVGSSVILIVRISLEQIY